MGEIIRVVCDNCDYEKQLKTGGGMLSIKAAVVEDKLKDEDLAQWKSLKESDKVRFFSWFYELAYCDDCKEISSCFNVKIQTTDGESLCLGGRCDKCHRKLVMLKKDEDIKCPICGKTTVAKNIVGHWD